MTAEFDDETARAIFQRDDWTCQAKPLVRAALAGPIRDMCLDERLRAWLTIECGPDLEAHHVTLRGMGGTSRTDLSDEANGLTLCRTCHRRAHDVDRAGAEAAGIIRRRNR